MANKGIHNFKNQLNEQDKTNTYSFSSRKNLTDNQKRGNDDFSKRGIGDELNVVGQKKRGRKKGSKNKE